MTETEEIRLGNIVIGTVAFIAGFTGAVLALGAVYLSERSRGPDYSVIDDRPASASLLLPHWGEPRSEPLPCSDPMSIAPANGGVYVVCRSRVFWIPNP